MRLLLNTLLVIVIVGFAACFVLYYRSTHIETASLDDIRADVHRFQRHVLLQATLGEVAQVGRGYPATIDPDWFDGDLPENPLLGPEHPWVEVAGPEQRNLEHPPNLIAVNPSVAKFWYNPYTGHVRARVPAGASDSKALRTYNYINDCDLVGLFASAPPTN